MRSYIKDNERKKLYMLWLKQHKPKMAKHKEVVQEIAQETQEATTQETPENKEFMALISCGFNESQINGFTAEQKTKIIGNFAKADKTKPVREPYKYDSGFLWNETLNARKSSGFIAQITVNSQWTEQEAYDWQNLARELKVAVPIRKPELESFIKSLKAIVRKTLEQ
jgi:hypothetical protein